MKNLINIKIKSQFLNIVILGFLLTVAGIILIIQTEYAGIAVLTLGLLIISLKRGVLIDVDNKKIKYYKTIAFIVFGDWEDCKDVRYLALTRVKISQKVNAIVVPGKFTDTQIKLNFIYDNNKAVAIISDKKSKIITFAMQIAGGFNVDIFDNSEGKKDWIKVKDSE